MVRIVLCSLLLAATALAEIPGRARPPQKNIPPPSRNREIASRSVYSPLGFKLGFVIDADVLLAEVPYADTSSRGYALGFGIQFNLKFSERLALTFTPQYQRTTLARDLSNSYAVAEPYQSVSQTIQYFGGMLMLSLLANNPLVPGTPFKTPEWWIDLLGVQHLRPFSATQKYVTASGDVESSFTSNDRLWMALVGVTGRMELGRNFFGVGSLHATYHIFAAKDHRLYGARLQLGVQLTL